MDFSALHVILELLFKATGQNVLKYIQICSFKKHSFEEVGKSLIVEEVEEMRYSSKELFPTFPVLKQIILSCLRSHIQVSFHSYYRRLTISFICTS